MKLSDFLDGVGHPVAYYPALAGPLGVKAVVLCCQNAHWQIEQEAGESGVHRTLGELSRATVLARTELDSARRVLRNASVLIETERRLEHKMFYRINLAVMQQLIAKAVDSRS